MGEPDREAYEAAERLVREAHRRAEEAAQPGRAGRRHPTAGRAPAARRRTSTPLFALLESLKGTLPPELAAPARGRAARAADRATRRSSTTRSTVSTRRGRPSARWRTSRSNELPASSGSGSRRSCSTRPQRPWRSCSRSCCRGTRRPRSSTASSSQVNVSALGAFTFVEGAILLVAVAVGFLVWQRARRRRASTCPAGTAWRSRWPAAGACCWSSSGCSTSPTTPASSGGCSARSVPPAR